MTETQEAQENEIRNSKTAAEIQAEIDERNARWRAMFETDYARHLESLLADDEYRANYQNRSSRVGRAIYLKLEVKDADALRWLYKWMAEKEFEDFMGCRLRKIYFEHPGKEEMREILTKILSQL